ncbi:MAG: hypothetical protein ACFFDH_22900 [Promethearchaeota archaeon]
MPIEEHEDNQTVTCCVMNCQAVVPIDKAIVIEGKYFCPICGVAYYRSVLKL